MDYTATTARDQTKVNTLAINVCMWFLSNTLTERRSKQNDSTTCVCVCVCVYIYIYIYIYIYFFFTAQEALVGQGLLTVHI